jgi:hypothetical protein
MESRNRALCDMQVWPTSQKLDWRGWLGNFPTRDQAYARCLLEAFVYLSNASADAMFISAFRALSREFRPFDNRDEVRRQWMEFLDRLLVVIVEGENPSPTDSAHLFARRARDLAGIATDRIVTPADALSRLLAGPQRPIVFVDDFVGSGNQFIETWTRTHVNSSGDVASFESRAVAAPVEAYYVPLVATEYGLQRIGYECPTVRVRPVHQLGNEYSCVHPESMVWRQDLVAGVPDFLDRSCTRAGLTVSEALGFHQLALPVGFEHGIPDATLRLFSHNTSSWRPLVRFV